MTIMLTLMQSGGSVVAKEGAGQTPYYVAGIILAILVGIMWALLAFGKGREHS